MTVQEEHRGQDPCSWIAVGRRESYDSHSVIRHSEEETRSGPPMKVENHQRCNEQRIGGGGGGGGLDMPQTMPPRLSLTWEEF